MNRFTFAIAAASIATMACAAGASGFDGSLDGGDPAAGDSSSLDGTIEAAVESGAGAVDAAAPDATDDVVIDTDPNDGGEESSVDGGRDRSPDASLDANVPDGAVVSPALGSCAPAAWVVTASISAANNPPAFAVDGLPPTRWSTGVDQAVGQYFQVDFGGLVSLDQVTLDDSFTTTEAADYPRGIVVLASTDGIDFGTTLATEAYATDPGAIVTIGFAAATARAIRLQLTTGVSSEWWSIHELRLGCQSLQTDGGGAGPSDGGAAPLPACAATAAGDAGWVANAGLSPAGWVGSASSTGPNDTIAGAFDESATTRWSSGQAQVGGEWFQVDLGAVTSVSGVALYLLDGNVTDYPSSYALQLSTDDLTFTTVASGLGAPTTAICVPPQSARYVKITQTGTGDPSWWSIYELNVFP